MTNLEKVVELYEREDGSNSFLDDEGDTVEEAIKAILVWREVTTLLGREIPEEFPLDDIWTDPKFESQRANLYERFQYHFGSSVGGGN